MYIFCEISVFVGASKYFYVTFNTLKGILAYSISFYVHNHSMTGKSVCNCRNVWLKVFENLITA